MKPQKRSPRKKTRAGMRDMILKDVRKAPSTFEEISTELENAGWGKDKLTQDIEESFCNIGVSFLDLKPHFELLKKAYEIFYGAGELLNSSTLNGFFAQSLLGRTCSCFLGAVRLSCSGQLTETYMLLRACVENSLYAFYIFDNAEHANIWANRGKDEGSKRKCKSTFVVRNIWGELEKSSRVIEKDARKFYDLTIDWGAHPNEKSLFPNIDRKQDGSGHLLRIHNTDIAFMRATILATIKASLLTFRIFALVFPEVFSQANIDVKVKNLDEQFKTLMAIVKEYVIQPASNKQ